MKWFKLAIVTSILTLLMLSGNRISQARASAINDYINQHHFTNVPVTVYDTTFTQWFGYRHGINQPEGVVIHETANPNSTIDGEVSYLQHNWRQIGAYVHGFIDHSRIINLHHTGYGVWGAGPNANSRFIQLELVREHSTDAFARSVNNDAYYVARLLKEYGLYPDLADNDGIGTIWSHNAVSYWLGGSDHTDPIGYFQQFGYDMVQFEKLVLQKYGELEQPTYNEIVKTEPVQQIATIRGNVFNGVYYLVNGQFQSFGSTMDYDGQVYEVYQIAHTTWGVDMALIGSHGQPSLWLNSGNLIWQ